MATEAEMLAQQYAYILTQSKGRLDVAGSMLTPVPGASDPVRIETIYLQFRKVIELMAFATLIGTKDQIARVERAIKEHWSGKRLFELVEGMNPKFFPEAVKITPPKIPGTSGAWTAQPGAMTKHECLALYDECLGLLNAISPFAKQPDWPRYSREASSWHTKFVYLLGQHNVRMAAHSGLLNCQMNVNGQVSVAIFEAAIGPNDPAPARNT